MRGARGVHGFGVNEADEGAVGDEAETVEAVLGGGGYELVGGLEGWVVGMGGGGHTARPMYTTMEETMSQ